MRTSQLVVSLVALIAGFCLLPACGGERDDDEEEVILDDGRDTGSQTCAPGPDRPKFCDNRPGTAGSSDSGTAGSPDSTTRDTGVPPWNSGSDTGSSGSGDTAVSMPDTNPGPMPDPTPTGQELFDALAGTVWLGSYHSQQRIKSLSYPQTNQPSNTDYYDEWSVHIHFRSDGTYRLLQVSTSYNASGPDRVVSHRTTEKWHIEGDHIHTSNKCMVKYDHPVELDGDKLKIRDLTFQADTLNSFNSYWNLHNAYFEDCTY